MRRVRGMLGDDCPVSLLRHDKSEQVFTHLVVGIRLKFGTSVFGRRRTDIVSNRSISSLDRHAGERCERSAKRKHNFGFLSHMESPEAQLLN